MPEQLIILASGSKIRQMMLDEAGVSFIVIKSQVDEKLIKSSFVNESFSERVKELAKAKAREVSKSHPDALVIGADQMCVLGNKIFDKPKIFKKAVENLSELSGKTHKQYSGVCLYKDSSFLWEHAESADLTMKDLSLKQIKNYIKEDNPLECCGCYKYESKGSKLFDSVIGSDNVIKGLALEALLDALKEYN